MKKRALRTTTSLFISLALVVTAAVAPTAAAQNEKKNKKDRKDKQAAAAVLAIESLNGTRYKMASTAMAKRVTRIADAAEDQFTNDGAPALDAPAHTDLQQVYVASTAMPRKLLGKQAKDYPEGTAGSFYGADAAWDKGAPAIFVAAKMAAKRPGGAGGQQLEIGVDGDTANPVQVGSADDTLAGLERFSLSGIFNNGAWSSGSTDVSGRAPGEAIEWYNTTSGAFGYYDTKRSTYYAIVPRTDDAAHVTVAVRSSTDQGEVIDRLELPGGGTLVDFKAAAGGFDGKAGLEPLTCRALETFSSESSDPTPTDPAATIIRYTAGVTAGTEAEAAAAMLAPTLDTSGLVGILLSEVGAEAAPLEVEAELAQVQGVDAVTLTMEVPAGQWTFEPAEGAQITLPNGEPLIDHGSLTGSAGVLTGPGLDGVVSGDPSCGWDDFEFPDEPEESASETDAAEPEA
jgi:hypothetical protein